MSTPEQSGNSNSEDIAERIHENPFYGIDFFKRLDEEKVYGFEEGEKRRAGWSRIEYYPRVGLIRVLKFVVGYDGKGGIQTWERDYRSNRNNSPHGDPDRDDLEVLNAAERLLRQKKIIQRKGFRFAPRGFPEIRDLVSGILWSGKRIIHDQLVEGECYLVRNVRDGEWVVFRYAGSMETVVSPGAKKRTYLAKNDGTFGSYAYLKLSNNYSPGAPWTVGGEEAFDIVFPNEGSKEDWSYHDEQSKEIFPITENDALKIAALRPVFFDPLIGSERTREELCINVAIQEMQYARWGADEIGKINPGQYVDITTENYCKALRLVISRFGEESFDKEVEKIILSHIQRLHTVIHTPDTPYAPHSDMSPLDSGMQQLASQVVLGIHQLSDKKRDMNFVENAKSLFGDVDFWHLMRTEYQTLFNRLVDYIMQLPNPFKQEKKNGAYRNAELDPVGLIQQYFSDAHREIVQSRADFVSNTNVAIQIIQ